MPVSDLKIVHGDHRKRMAGDSFWPTYRSIERSRWRHYSRYRSMLLQQRDRQLLHQYRQTVFSQSPNVINSWCQEVTRAKVSEERITSGGKTTRYPIFAPINKTHYRAFNTACTYHGGKSCVDRSREIQSRSHHFTSDVICLSRESHLI